MPSSMRTWLVALFVLLGGALPGWGAPRPRAAAKAPAVKASGKPAAGKAGGQAAAGNLNDLVAQGIAAQQAKDIPLATRLLEDAYRKTRRTEVLYYLGHVAVAANRPVAAQDLFRRYLADPSHDPDEEAVKTAEEMLRQKLPPTGTLFIQSDPGAVVLVDDRIVGTLPLLLPLLLSAEPHNVVLEYPGKKLEAPIQVQPGRISELRISRGSGVVLVRVLPAVLFHSEYGDLPPEMRKALSDVMDQAVHGEQHATLSTDDAAMQSPELKDCASTDSCRRKLAEKNKVQYILTLRTSAQTVGKETNWKLGTELFHVDIKEPAATATIECSGCTLDTVVARLKETSVKLFTEGLTRKRGDVHITVEPAAAELYFGAQNAVSSPYDAALWVGNYELMVKHPGYRIERRSVDVQEGRKSELQVQLEKEVVADAGAKKEVQAPPVSTERRPRPRWRLALGGVLVGAGLALVGLGAAGVIRDGACLEPPALELEMCPEVYNTRGGGIAGISLGGALTLTGAVLLALPGPRPPGLARLPSRTATSIFAALRFATIQSVP